jgi:hypothetical protein
MVVWRQSKVSTNDRKTGRADIPNSSREFHCADVGYLWRWNLRRLAAGFEDASVEAHAMGSDKICADKQVPDSWPQHLESGLSSNMFPGDAMYGREEEGTSSRADQVIFSLNDSIARNSNETDCASTIGIMVGRLEIDRDEGQGAPPEVARQQLVGQPPILYYRPSRA